MSRGTTRVISLAEGLLSVFVVLVGAAAGLAVERFAVPRLARTFGTRIEAQTRPAAEVARAREAYARARADLVGQRSVVEQERALAERKRQTRRGSDSLGRQIAYGEYVPATPGTPPTRLTGASESGVTRAESLLIASTAAAVRAQQSAERAVIAERARSALRLRPMILWGGAGALAAVLIACGVLGLASRADLLYVRATPVLVASVTMLLSIVAIRLFGVLGVAIAAVLMVLVPVFASDRR